MIRLFSELGDQSKIKKEVGCPDWLKTVNQPGLWFKSTTGTGSGWVKLKRNWQKGCWVAHGISGKARGPGTGHEWEQRVLGSSQEHSQNCGTEALPWPQNPGKLGPPSGLGLNGDRAVAATLESVHGCHSCCHPHRRRFSKGFSLCLWVRIQVVLLIGQAQVTCLSPANEGGWEASVLWFLSLWWEASSELELPLRLIRWSLPRSWEGILKLDSQKVTNVTYHLRFQILFHHIIIIGGLYNKYNFEKHWASALVYLIFFKLEVSETNFCEF